MEIQREFVREDRNGTKYWNIKETCPRCGGRGDYIVGNLNYGVCFECGGTRVREYVFKEYTPEHEAKLEAAREKRAAKKQQLAIWAQEQKENEWILTGRERAGFNVNGIGYIHYGNTFEARDELRRGGAKWCNGLQAWIAPKRIECEGVKILEVKAEEICYPYGGVDFDKACDLREKLN